MVNALVLFKTKGWVTDEVKERLQHTSLSNAKQLLCGQIRDEAIVDLAASTIADLNAALGKLAELAGVESATIIRLITNA
jgi:hypothetical protein